LRLRVGDGGGFSSTEAGYSGGSDFQDRPSRTAQFEEYDEYDDGGARAPVTRSSIPRKSTPKKESAPAPKKEVVDLFSFDDELPSTTTPATTSNGKGKSVETSSALAADDDFDDFQSATTTTTTTTAPKSTSFPSLFDSNPVQPTAARGTIPSTTPSFANFGISSPPVQQPLRSTNPTPAFGMGTSSTFGTGMTSPPALSGMGKPSTTNYQPNYFSPPQTTTAVSPFRP
jgi:epsin